MEKKHSAEIENLYNEGIIADDIPGVWEYVIDKIIDAQEALDAAREYVFERFSIIEG